MIDFSTRDTLPKDDFGKIAIPTSIIDTAEPSNMGPLLNSGLSTPDAEDKENDYNNLLDILREDYYTCCRYFIDSGLLAHGHYGDDCGDYRNAAADIMTMLQTHFDMALWHSELNTEMITELNLWLNCADEEHCIHQFAIDGPNLWLDRVAIDWESCPVNNPIGI